MIIGVMGNAGSGKDTVAGYIAPVHLVWQNGKWRDVTSIEGEPRDSIVPGAVQLAFADPLKVTCQEIYDFSDLQLWGPSKYRNAPDHRYPRIYAEHKADILQDDGKDVCTRCKATRSRPVIIGNATWEGPCKDYLTPREALQILGTEWGRRCWPDTWVSLCSRRAKDLILETYVEKVDASWMNKHYDAVVISDVRFGNEIDFLHADGGVVWRIDRDGNSNLDAQHAAHASEVEQRKQEVFEKVDLTLDNNGTLEELRVKTEEAIRGLFKTRIF